jgi:prolipoprotein diacylglyceryl transferase
MLGAPALIPSPSSNGLSVGPFVLHAYGLMYVVGLLAAIWITRRRWRGDPNLVYAVVVVAFPAGVLGGRLYFDITTPDQVQSGLLGPLAIWSGGLGIWGGVLAGTLAGIWVLRRRGANVAAFLDAAAPGMLVAQGIGRIGNYFNQELFGKPSSLPWALKIDAVHRPPGYEHFASFQPTFLYELIWNVSLAVVLIWIGSRRRLPAPAVFALYVGGYALARIFEELLRIDPANHVLGLRLNFFVAVGTFVAASAWLVGILTRSRATGRGVALEAA